MIVAYGLSGENARAAAQIYAERFPGRARYPTARRILRVVQQLRESGCLVHNLERIRAPHLRVQDEERILNAIYEDPGASVRRLAHQLGISRYAVHHTLRVNALHSYHYQRVQQLLPRDERQRIYFCEGSLHQISIFAIFLERYFIYFI